VKYCNITCQKSHRKKHKKECKRRAAELLFDEALFKQPPPREDCPICFLRLPIEEECYYQYCCGKTLCAGCVHVITKESNLCAFCRAPAATSREEINETLKKRMEAGDSRACVSLGEDYHARGELKKALEFYLRAVELGSAEPHLNIAFMYSHHGEGVIKYRQKELHHLICGAMEGCERSRYHIGSHECEMGNFDRAYRHWMIAARTGHKVSLDNMETALVTGHVSKAEYEEALRAYQEYYDEVKSDQRDRATAELTAPHG